mmetsp:Transcript_2541/g.3644  ORF Transcript_2541/g.3644 Transcript_2541/m.3644 type:complete len:160 (-) Transcript_2541:816-1295(-)
MPQWTNINTKQTSQNDDCRKATVGTPSMRMENPRRISEILFIRVDSTVTNRDPTTPPMLSARAILYCASFISGNLSLSWSGKNGMIPMLKLLKNQMATSGMSERPLSPRNASETVQHSLATTTTGSGSPRFSTVKNVGLGWLFIRAIRSTVATAVSYFP